jgi:hypothetical protein
MIPQYIIVHCSATKDSGTVSWGAIRNYHINDNGWTDIGYHFGVEDYGDEIILLRGRAPWTSGAHCRAAGRNRDSLGLCVVGDFDHEPPSEEKYAAVVAVLTSLCFMFNIPPDRVRGHSEFEPNKTCPGLMWDMVRTRTDIATGIERLAGVGDYLVV